MAHEPSITNMPEDPAEQWRIVGEALGRLLEGAGDALGRGAQAIEELPIWAEPISVDQYEQIRGVKDVADAQADRLAAAREQLAGGGVNTDPARLRGSRNAPGAVRYNPGEMLGLLPDGRAALGWPHEMYAAPNRPRGSLNPRSTYGGYYFDDRTGSLVKDETGPQGPRYAEGDEYDPEGKPPAWIARMQDHLVKAGVLDGRTYQAGRWDDATRAAYRDVLGYANRQGMTWETALPELIAVAQDPAAKEARRAALRAQAPAFVPEAYERPDPAALAQDVKQFVRRRLGGRNPSAEEMTALSAQLSADDLAAHEQNTVVAEDLHGRQVEAQVAAALGEGGTPVAATTTYEDVDPTARFAEAFERHYAGELSTRDTSTRVAEQGRSLAAGMDRMRAQLAGSA